MNTTLALILVWAFQIYVAIGIVFAVLFLWRGLAEVDRGAAEGTRPFRAILLPGIIGLWPVLLLRWLGGQKGVPPTETNAHRRAAAERS